MKESILWVIDKYKIYNNYCLGMLNFSYVAHCLSLLQQLFDYSILFALIQKNS